MIILGYAIGLLVGVIMGLLGGGGSLLLPVLLYLLCIKLNDATAYTTFLVGITALVGVIPRIKSKEIEWNTVLALGIPVSIGMWLVRAWLNGAIPDLLFQIGDFAVTKKRFVLAIFAVLLVLSFASMAELIGKDIKPREELRTERPMLYYLILGVCGLLIGILPGFTGAGGGVLIVPLLVIFFGTPMKTVVGTSLTIIAMKSFVGFFGGDFWKPTLSIDWKFLVGFSVTMIIGVLIGSRLGNRVDSRKLKVGFGWFVLALAVFIFIKEFFLPAPAPAAVEGIASFLDSTNLSR